MIKVFFIEEIGYSETYLRRYTSGDCPLMPGQYSRHDAMVPLERIKGSAVCGDTHPHDDPRWPSHCECGYQFTPDDTWQLFSRRLYRRIDTGEEMTLNTAPVGACWNAWWYTDMWKGSDDRCLVVKTPGGEWIIDHRAANCTMRDDTIHKCWVRHGRPEDGTLHVDKNGYTCAAGAGSIVCGDYHGFLHQGHLTSC